MADGKSLRIDGLVLGAFTVAVMLIAGAVVRAHVDGRLSLDEIDRPAAALSWARR